MTLPKNVFKLDPYSHFIWQKTNCQTQNKKFSNRLNKKIAKNRGKIKKKNCQVIT